MEHYGAGWKQHIAVRRAALQNRKRDDDSVFANNRLLLNALVDVTDSNVREYLWKTLKRGDDLEAFVATGLGEFPHSGIVADFLCFVTSAVASDGLNVATFTALLSGVA